MDQDIVQVVSISPQLRIGLQDNVIKPSEGIELRGIIATNITIENLKHS